MDGTGIEKETKSEKQNKAEMGRGVIKKVYGAACYRVYMPCNRFKDLCNKSVTWAVRDRCEMGMGPAGRRHRGGDFRAGKKPSPRRSGHLRLRSAGEDTKAHQEVMLKKKIVLHEGHEEARKES